MVITGVRPSLRDPCGEGVGPVSCPPQRATAKLPASSTVTTRDLVLALEKWRNQTDGSAGGEEEYVRRASFQARWRASFALPS